MRKRDNGALLTEFCDAPLTIFARWGEYIGARFATYQAVVDAIATWMKKMSAGMTDAEASIVAATVCHGIDRDGDGELT